MKISDSTLDKIHDISIVTVAEKLGFKLYGMGDEGRRACCPYHEYPRAAQDKLLRWIKKNSRFHKRLLRLATTKDDNNYSKEQIRLLIDKFGEPGEYDDY